MLPAILAGHDVLAAGPPGAGTSTAALLAVLCKVLSTPRTVPRNRAMPLAVVLCPSRELAMQLAAEGSKLVAGTQITVKCVTGGAEMTQQVRYKHRVQCFAPMSPFTTYITGVRV